MVKLSMDMIARGTSGYTKKKRDEETEHYLARLTHLYLEDKSIDEVGEDLALCRNLSVLYLYDNKVDRIPDLSQNYCLTHLYLQNNQITVMSNLNQLRKLTKLYLGGNEISVVEGIDKLECLEELHVENQKLPAGEKLLFDPRSLQAISRSLRVLNLAGNNLDSLKEFSVIVDLRQLTASENQLTDFKEVNALLSKWRRLAKLDLNDNPFCTKAKYRDRVIVMSDSLDMFDGKEVTATTRQFLKNWKASKDAQRRRKEELDLLQDHDLYGGAGDLPHTSNGVHRSQLNKISSYVMPGLPRRQFEEVLAKSSANMPSNAVPFSAPPLKSHSDQFISSPHSGMGQLQRKLMEQHKTIKVERAKSHIPRTTTIQF